MPTTPISTSTFQAPLFRTSFGPGESPDLHRTNSGQIFLRTSLGPDQMGALSTRVGDGAATSPSFGDRALSFLKGKFEAFVGKLEGFGEKLGTLQDSAREGINAAVGSARAYVSEKIDALTERFSAPSASSSSAPARTNPTTAQASTASLGPAYQSWTTADIAKKGTAELGAVYHDCVLKASNDTTDNTAEAFLRTDTKHKDVLSVVGSSARKEFGNDVLQALPRNGVVALFASDYDPSSTRFLKDGQPIVTAENRAQHGADAASFIKGAFDRLTGTDAQSTTAAATRLPQEFKDILATGYAAIDASSMPDHLKDAAKEKLGADAYLRVFSPGITDKLTNPDPARRLPDLETASMRGIARTMLTIANGRDITNVATNPLADEVKTALAPQTPQILSNLKALFAEAAAQGTAYPPQVW